MQAGADCTRQKQLGTDFPCKPAWSGRSNGGATYHGVTASKVTVVVYLDDSQTSVSTPATASQKDYQAVLPGYEQYLNKNFQFYGRKLNLVFQYGPTQSSSGTGDAADVSNADTAVQQNDAFSVVTSSASDAFAGELARLQAPVLSELGSSFTSQLAQTSPYVFQITPNMDLVTANLSSYYCRRLAGRPAQFAGESDFHSRTRRLGVIEAKPMPGSPDPAQALSQYLSQMCGATIAKEFQFSNNVATASEQATNAMSAMKASGVTTVTCLCSYLPLVFGTDAAAAQDYFPEWLDTSLDLTDAQAVGRLFNQTEWDHAFGPAWIPWSSPTTDQTYWRAYYSVEPAGTNQSSVIKTGGVLWPELLQMALAIEASGPDLTPTNLAKTLFSLAPLRSTTPGQPPDAALTISFGNSFSPDPPYSPFAESRDFAEVWWCGTCTGTDGQVGTYYYVDAGHRYLYNQWPTTVPDVLTPDGSAQPPRDPELNASNS